MPEQLKHGGIEMRVFITMFVAIFGLLVPTLASADGWFGEGRYMIGQSTTRLNYGALSVSTDSNFRSYGMIGGYGWTLGESPYTLSVVGGVYGGGISESGTYTSGLDSASLAYDQPWAVTLGARFGADYNRWSPYVEAGIVATRHQLEGSLIQGGVTTNYADSAMTIGGYGEVGVGYAFSQNGRFNVAVQGRYSSRGEMTQTTLAAVVGLRWDF